MTDPISATVGVLTLGQRLAGAIRWLWQRFTTKRWAPRSAPLMFEARPISFTIDLAAQIPRIEIRFYVINYLAKPVSLEDVHVTRLTLGEGLSLDGIRLVPALEGVVIPGRESRLVFCTKNLMDSEVRAIESLPTNMTTGVSFTSRAKGKRRAIDADPMCAIAIEGWINKRGS